MNNIHPLADCMSPHIGEGTSIWQFCVVLPEARIGADCNICANVVIENDVHVGDHVTVKSGVQLWNGITLEDKVYVGPNATFTNDMAPRSKNKDFHQLRTVVRTGASIGANATVIGGIEIGEYALIGAGSVVTRDVPPHALMMGNPARQKGFVTRSGILLDIKMRDKQGQVHGLEE